jgi:hypothetical protein
VQGNTKLNAGDNVRAVENALLPNTDNQLLQQAQRQLGAVCVVLCEGMGQRGVQLRRARAKLAKVAHTPELVIVIKRLGRHDAELIDEARLG